MVDRVSSLTGLRARIGDLRYSDHLRLLPEARELGAGGKPLRVGILRSYTIEAIEPALELRLLSEGYVPSFWFGGYNQYAQEILVPGSDLYRFEPDVVILCIRLEELMPAFVDSFGEAGCDWKEVLRQSAHELADLIRHFRARSSAQVLVQNLVCPVAPYWGIYDAQLADGQRFMVADFNRLLAEELAEVPGAYIWDFAGFIEGIGQQQLFDPKGYYLSKTPYRQSMLPGLADDLQRYLLSMLGRLRKCVVLDLDNTLWGGIIGEDGIDGIQLGHTYPGVCFREFQKNLLKLYQRGVILAINSKNNESDALHVLDRHPDMVLRREHFAAMQINWQDKATNLRVLASALNIGLESMIVVDDNHFECELIQSLVPECHVVCLPAEPYRLPSVAERLPGLENLRLTSEDKQKGRMYQAQVARQEHQRRIGDLDQFLRSLEMEVTIEPASKFSVPRLAQLTQKTNQFNVTTRRYTDADIDALAAAPDSDVYSVAVRDKFGDNGIVGVIVVRYSGAECLIDSLLLSCRVIGRNIESLMIAFIAEQASLKGARVLVGQFIPTAKNAPAANLFPLLGFAKIDDTRFEAVLDSCTFSRPDYIRLSGEEAD